MQLHSYTQDSAYQMFKVLFEIKTKFFSSPNSCESQLNIPYNTWTLFVVRQIIQKIQEISERSYLGSSEMIWIIESYNNGIIIYTQDGPRPGISQRRC